MIETGGAATLSRRARLRRRIPALLLLAALVVVSILVIPRMHVDRSIRSVAYELDASQPTAGLRTRGAITRNVYGFVVGPRSTGAASFDIVAPAAAPGARTVLIVTAGQPTAPTQVTLVDGSGGRHLLGTARTWRAHSTDVTSLLAGRRGRISLAATNGDPAPQLIGDRVVVANVPSGAAPRAGRWEVAGWVALLVLFALVALRRLRRDFVLVPVAALTAFLVWPSIGKDVSQTGPSDLWTAAVHAKWLDLDHGVLSGTFGALSNLTVQLFHALTPLTGTGAAGAAVASMLVGVVAIVAIYALGRRVAGMPGAIAAVTCALLADPFRTSLGRGDGTGTVVLAACLFLLAVYGALRRADRESMAWVGATGAIAILAEPLWWPGVVAAIVLLALRGAPRDRRRAAFVAGLAVFALVSLPSRVSVAHQSAGDLTADVTLRSTLARNSEFVGRGHTAPPDAAALAADPFGGQQIGLGSYLFGDHTLSVLAGGTLSGAYDGLSAAAARPDTGLAGLLAFIAELVGVVFLLVLPRLRLLVIVPALLALVPWFFASRGVGVGFLSETAFWPALLAGVAALAYSVREAARRRFGATRFAGVLSRAPGSIARRAGRRAAEPAQS